jgi:hypothetical protein
MKDSIKICEKISRTYSSPIYQKLSGLIQSEKFA